MISITTCHSIESVNRHDWDLLSRDQILMHRGWLKTIEQTYVGSMTPCYLILYENERPVAATAYRQIHPEAGDSSFDYFLFGRLQPFLSQLGISALPLMASMPLKGYPAQFLVRPHNDPSTIQDRRQAVLSAIHTDSRRQRMPVVFTKVVAGDGAVVRLLRRNGYARMIASPLAYLDIVWPTFRAYRQDNSRLSRNIRRKIPWEINRNRKAGIDIVLLENPGGYEEALYRMVTLNASKHSQAGFSYNDRFFNLLNANMPNETRVYAAFKKGVMVGMSLFLTHADIWHALLVGIDHHVEANDLTYFNIAYYRPIRDAIESQCKRIYYGNSHYELKMRRGCQLLPVHTFYKPHGLAGRMGAKPYFFFHRAWNRMKRQAIVRRQLKSK